MSCLYDLSEIKRFVLYYIGLYNVNDYIINSHLKEIWNDQILLFFFIHLLRDTLYYDVSHLNNRILSLTLYLS